MYSLEWTLLVFFFDCRQISSGLTSGKRIFEFRNFLLDDEDEKDDDDDDKAGDGKDIDDGWVSADDWAEFWLLCSAETEQLPLASILVKNKFVGNSECCREPVEKMNEKEGKKSLQREVRKTDHLLPGQTTEGGEKWWSPGESRGGDTA